MSDNFQQKVVDIERRGLVKIEEIKHELEDAMDALKKANKELEECPKEDASENAPLQTARENQARANHTLFALQKRLNAFEQSLTNYTPIGVITMGSTVQIVLETIDGSTPEEDVSLVLRLVHHDASDVASGYMSISSRVGAAIMGHVEGDSVTISAPRGTLCYKIERVY